MSMFEDVVLSWKRKILSIQHKVAKASAPGLPKQIILPSPPFGRTGAPANPNNSQGRYHRASYDWKRWDPNQLKIMEEYWLEFVRLYQSLLPRTLQEKPNKYRGINLGTFNGCYQKAWMRLGYKMYGVELADVAEELHEYGCEGERNSFFHLDGLQDESFDFAIMDRCMFISPEQAYFCSEDTGKFEEYSEIGVQNEFFNTDGLKPTKTPPFFEQPLRVLKPDGILLAILYRNWSEAAVRELFDAGDVTLLAVKRPQPYLVAVVDKGKQPKPFPEVRDSVDKLNGTEPEELLRQLSRDRAIGKSTITGPNEIRFHHLPTNRLVRFNTESKDVVEDPVFLNCDDFATFFLGIDPMVEFSASTDGAVTVLCVDQSMLPKTRTKKIATTISKVGRSTFLQPGLTKGSRSLAAARDQIIEVTKGFSRSTVVVGTGVFDSIINVRNGRPRVALETSREILEDIDRILGETPHKLAVVVPPKITCEGSTPVSKLQKHQVDAYRKMVCDLANTANFEIIETGVELKLGENDVYGSAVKQHINQIQSSILDYLK